jgi:hypothetical protein
LSDFFLARRILDLLEVVLKRPERFFVTSKPAGGNANVVLELSSIAEPIRVPEVHQRLFVVRGFERGSSSQEVLACRNIIRRFLGDRGPSPKPGAAQNQDPTEPANTNPPDASHPLTD